MFSMYDVLALVCGLVLVLKVSKKGYKALGACLVVATLWGAVVVPGARTIERKVKAVITQADHVEDYTRDQITTLVIAESLMGDLDPAIALAFSEAETNHRNITGDNGRSYGPLQVQAQYHIPEGDPTDPKVSVAAGVALIARLLERHHGDVVKARIAYVCGSLHSCSAGKTAKIERRIRAHGSAYGLTL